MAEVRISFLKQEIEKELKLDEGSSIVKLVDLLLEYAFLNRASDVHIDPESTKLAMRLRIDGVLRDAFVFPKELQPEIISRIKVLSGLRTDEHQMAQDGRFRATIVDVGYVDVRVSIVPTYDGENAILRLLSERTKIVAIEDLDLNEKDLFRLQKAIRRPYGMILATGPTGSGKTTTLYTVIRALNTKEVSILTIEDPIEYAIAGIDQIQVNTRTGLTFANGLRSILRQDPNIIMVGEIRDEETAGIAVNAALTGHLLLSTIHTNDAATAFPRLIDMKIEPFLITSTVNIVVGQRLVRRICPDCKIEMKITHTEFESLFSSLTLNVLKNNREFFKGKGCDQCNQSGYYGRLGIYEVLEIDDSIRDAIMQRKNASVIRSIAIKNGMTTMLEDGFKKAIEGKTTIEEILRVIHE
ncbi:hypothetical protein A3G50_02815 [Candidatus Jorgensenbacteria bacterium RIFCSPLOWO2_12_FULL_42_11]|uniref:AAA+ ATPase domain-containing protein n=1 Tax=Candidatus Jorgensenbacteria bacterium RIFCSPLOWO2_12_FULL_42_11 TaxID=1798473 RepID=A0A1F6C4A9_9BACT|nr:MAG: hypothetical protein A3G50_02815 [Candidatus Jorgensenbacteria bacterium RIFCSPLOWO2_12_FULL_42_11]